MIQTFAVASRDHDGVREILVNSHHLYQYPNQLADLDSAGQILGEFWHSGQIPMMDARTGTETAKTRSSWEGRTTATRGR